MYRYSLRNWVDSDFSKVFLIRDAAEVSFCAIYPPNYPLADNLQPLVAGSEAQLNEWLHHHQGNSRYTKLLAWALGIGEGRGVEQIAHIVNRMQFVLTPEIAMKLLLIHERKVQPTYFLRLLP